MNTQGMGSYKVGGGSKRMLETMDDDEMNDGGMHGSKGASPKRMKIGQVDPRCRTGDAKSQTRKRRKVVKKTNGIKMPDIRMFWKGKGDQLPGDLNFN